MVEPWTSAGSSAKQRSAFNTLLSCIVFFEARFDAHPRAPSLFLPACTSNPSAFGRVCRASQAQRDGLRLEANNASMHYRTKQQGTSNMCLLGCGLVRNMRKPTIGDKTHTHRCLGLDVASKHSRDNKVSHYLRKVVRGNHDAVGRLINFDSMPLSSDQGVRIIAPLSPAGFRLHFCRHRSKYQLV